MEAETLFAWAGRLVIPGWLLLVFLPKWRFSATLIGAVIIPVLLGVTYAWLVATHMAGAEGGFDSLAGVDRLFENEYLLLAGWIHYLAFDLFVGSWEVRDAQRHGIHHLAVVPCLVLTFLAGPAGLLVYLVMRFAWKRRFLVVDD